jgi:hypothetical protein
MENRNTLDDWDLFKATQFKVICRMRQLTARLDEYSEGELNTMSQGIEEWLSWHEPCNARADLKDLR